MTKINNKNVGKAKMDIIKKVAMLILLGQAATVGSAEAALRRNGPINAVHGFPEWYQDFNNLAMDLCIPQTQAELDAGICLTLPADLPLRTAPEVFPSNFSVEHFYYGSGSTLSTNSSLAGVGGGTASLFLALEASFIGGKPLTGDQVVFSRVRIRISDLPSAGNYRVIHPYGIAEFPNMPAGGAINFTDDYGVNCGVGRFDCLLNGPMGPFLQPINPDGTKKAPFVLGANKFLSDGVTLEKVAGGPFGNKFRIEGPNIGGPGVDFMETDLFTVNGRIHTAPIPTPLKVLSAKYSRSAAAGAKVDVFAEANPGNVLSMVLNSNNPATAPVSTGSLMSPEGNLSSQHGQILLANPAALAPSVTVYNNSDVPVSFSSVSLEDKISVSLAEYDPATKSLSVTAKSSDEFSPPILSVDLGSSVAANPIRQLLAGSAVISGVAVAPSDVTVISSAGGKIKAPVSVKKVLPPAAVVVDDAATTNEDTAVDVLVAANDLNVTPGTYAIALSPVNGTVVINQNLVQNVELTSIRYTPKANFNGIDKFSYVAVGLDGVTSKVATVTVLVNPLNDAPSAVADSTCILAGKTAAINVMANDSDVDGNLVAGSATIVARGATNRGTATITGGVLNYAAPATLQAGVASAVDTFDYQIVDSNGLVGTATVTVNIYAGETLTVTSATYTTKQLRWVIVGTSNINAAACGNSVTAFNGSTLAGAVIGSGAVDILGNWQIQVTPSSVPVAATRTISVQSKLGSTRLAVPITIK